VDIQGSEKEQTFYIAPGCGATGSIYATTLREAAIRELAEAVNAFPAIVRAKVKAAVVAANERREAELARAAQASRPGFSPGF